MQVYVKELKVHVGRCDDARLVINDFIEEQDVLTVYPGWWIKNGYLYLTPFFDLKVQQAAEFQAELQQYWNNLSA